MISQREMGRKDQFRRNMSPLTSDLSPQRCRDRSNSPLSRKMVRIPMVAVGELHCGGGVVDLCVETWIFGVIFESEVCEGSALLFSSCSTRLK